MSRSLLLLLVLAASGCGVTQVVDRAEDGTAILIRSPQPDEDDLHDLAAEHGVRTVVNLRGVPEPETGWYQAERRGVEEIGARWVTLKVSGGVAPPQETVDAFCALVEDPHNWPILIHCQGGVHRTGLMSALYRIQYQGWSAEAAVAEMEDLWFDWTTRDRDALKRWLRAYRPDPGHRVPREAPAARAPQASPRG